MFLDNGLSEETMNQNFKIICMVLEQIIVVTKQ